MRKERKMTIKVVRTIARAGLKKPFSPILAGLVLLASPAASQRVALPEKARPQPLAWSDIADLAAASPLVIKASVRKISKVSIASAEAGTAPQEYLLVRARVDSLIRGDQGVPPEIRFLTFPSADTDPMTFNPRKVKSILVFARPGANPGEVRLVSRYAMRPATPDLETTTRSIVTELLTPDAPPAIIAVGDAFHVAGTVAGEGETQIFLKTATGTPVSLSIVHHPDEPPRWGVALGEIVDETAVPPEKNSLLWYRLACGLPDQLPPSATQTLPLADMEAAQRDYRFVLESLGRCGRTL